MQDVNPSPIAVTVFRSTVCCNNAYFTNLVLRAVVKTDWWFTPFTQPVVKSVLGCFSPETSYFLVPFTPPQCFLSHHKKGVLKASEDVH